MSGDGFWNVGQVELDGTPATGLEVYEEQPVPGPEQIARVRFAVQRLFGRAPRNNCPRQVAQPVAQELPVPVAQIWSVGADVNQPLRLRDAISEVRSRKIDVLQTSVQPYECVRILGRSRILR